MESALLGSLSHPVKYYPVCADAVIARAIFLAVCETGGERKQGVAKRTE